MRVLNKARLTQAFWTALHLTRVPSDGGLDHPLPLHHSQEHPGGPLEPAQLHQNPGGQSAEIRGRLAEQTHQRDTHAPSDAQHKQKHCRVRLFTFAGSESALALMCLCVFSFLPCRWKEPAPPGAAQVHRYGRNRRFSRLKRNTFPSRRSGEIKRGSNFP